MEPLISVIIPTYNEAARIGRAVRSMQDQTYKNLEIIVVDDGSTDDTRGIVEAIAARDPRVSFVAPPDPAPKRTNWRGYDINAGFAARNYGFGIARGEWITTQDADDASLLNRIETQYELAKKYGADMVTIMWQRYRSEIADKSLDVAAIFKDKGEHAVIIRPEETYRAAVEARGILMREPLHRFIPFTIKWFPYTRKFFFRNTKSYPGADNCMLFHRRVRDQGLYFRPRNERTWGAPSGRGSGRDFAHRVAFETKNAWSFRLPLYLWDVKLDNPDFVGYDRYLI
ncbi:MAG: glycosyltransferase family 2 protein [Patescibacteria group bacterium]|nr:glycosyltransferase family 2 protein [Patescibacteria group bacterium]MDE2116370.1 glycosyltransferase family 2 protein [Patescibacteria group bacterium]